MSNGMIRFFVLGGALLLIVGCGGSAGGGSGSGGSGGNGGNSSTTVTFTITGGPTAVATKTGSGSFSVATLNNGSLTLSLPSGTTNFAVAYVCPSVAVSPSRQLTNQYIAEESTLDGSSFSRPCSTTPSTGATGTLTGSVDASAISGANAVSIFAENGNTSSFGSPGVSSSSFSFAAPTGTDRVEVLAYNSTLNGNSLVAAKDFSGVTVPGALNGGNTVVLGSADVVTLEPITYNGVPSGFSAPTTTVVYTMGNNGFVIANAATSEYTALPATAMESGDFYYLSTFAQGSGQVIVETISTSSGPISFTFPPAWTYAGPAAAKWPSFDIAYTGFSGTTGICDEVGVTWIASSTVVYQVNLTATGNYLNGSTTVAVPDLSGLPGFAAAPASGTSVIWGAYLSSQGSTTCLNPNPQNLTTKTVTSGGAYTAP